MKNIIAILLSVMLISCGNDSIGIQDCVSIGNLRYLVLCEGMYGYNNAELWGIGESGTSELFYCNNQRKLGDTANDMLKLNDSTYIVIVSTSNEIIKLGKNGVMLASYQVKGAGHFLKKACMINDSIIAITDLYADKIYLFNHHKIHLDSLDIKGLCAPDGIAFAKNTFVICNSGYGIFRKNDLNSSTIAVHDLHTSQTKFLKTGVNPQHVSHDEKNNHWFVQFAHLTTNPDSLGGIQIFDEKFTTIKEFRGSFIGIPTIHNDSVYAINGKSIVCFAYPFSKYDTLIINNTQDNWYRIGMADNTLYICNARTFSTKGFIMLLDETKKTIKSQYFVGMNPSIMIAI